MKIGIEEPKIETTERIIDKGIIEVETIEKEAMKGTKEIIERRIGARRIKIGRQRSDETTEIKGIEVRIEIEMTKGQGRRDTDKVINNLCRHS